MSNAAALQRTDTWLRAWDSQGHHRTGTDGDRAGADWAIAAARALGVAVEREAFSFDRLDPGEAYLEIDGTKIPGVPVFDAPPTAGTTGTTGTEIAVVALPPGAVFKARCDVESLALQPHWPVAACS